MTQSCQTLCDPMDCSPPGSSVHGIFQARILEWVVISSSRGISSTEGLNSHLLSLLHLQVDSLPLHHIGSPSTPIHSTCFTGESGIAMLGTSPLLKSFSWLLSSLKDRIESLPWVGYLLTKTGRLVFILGFARVWHSPEQAFDSGISKCTLCISSFTLFHWFKWPPTFPVYFSPVVFLPSPSSLNFTCHHCFRRLPAYLHKMCFNGNTDFGVTQILLEYTTD